MNLVIAKSNFQASLKVVKQSVAKCIIGIFCFMMELGDAKQRKKVRMLLKTALLNLLLFCNIV